MSMPADETSGPYPTAGFTSVVLPYAEEAGVRGGVGLPGMGECWWKLRAL